jgi:hypothetical protein
VSAATGEQQIETKAPSYPWHELLAPANIPNWILAFIGALGVGAAVLTLREIDAQVRQMKTQTDLTERQLRLQEVPFRQWVEIGLWKNLTPHPQPTATEPTVVLNFEIRNATQFPFTLKRVATKRGGEAFALSNMKHLIPPNDSYLAYISFDISPAELELYRRDQATAMIEIETEIRDVLLKDCEPQHFQQTVTFGPNRCEAAEHRPHYHMRIKQVR